MSALAVFITVATVGLFPVQRITTVISESNSNHAELSGVTLSQQAEELEGVL
jgi:hypothetical protein